MGIRREGFTTVDCLVGLICFSVGVLGTSATVALAIRTAAEGSNAVRAARLLVTEAARLSAEIARGAGACSGATPGSRTGQGALRVTSSAIAVSGGQDVRIVVAYPTARGQRSDTATTFLPCH